MTAVTQGLWRTALALLGLLLVTAWAFQANAQNAGAIAGSSSGSTSGANSGSASGANASGVVIGGDRDDRQTRKLYGNPDVITNTPQSTAPCYVVAGGGGSGGLIGASVNVPFFDDECNDRFWFINLHQAGLTDFAITYLCMERETMAQLFGDKCGDLAGHAKPTAETGYQYVLLKEIVIDNDPIRRNTILKGSGFRQASFTGMDHHP